jgi:alkylhydroperoxidase family enzyme
LKIGTADERRSADVLGFAALTPTFDALPAYDALQTYDALIMHIEPLRAEEIRDPELKALIARCEALGVPDAVFPRILARVPAYAKALLRALLVSHAEGNVDHRLKEVIRVQLARTAGDPYFAGLRSARARQLGLDEETIKAGSGKFEDDARFTAAEKWALRYAREMYLNPENVNAAFYAEGKQHYSEAQIMELGAFIAFHYGMQVFMRTVRTHH